ncbi:MAG: hypothetical protein H0V82_02565 [Candidatus Protochlamydia sp.]|nr:hypothetical protein [Candidatus Protochlamydia sp.]
MGTDELNKMVCSYVRCKELNKVIATTFENQGYSIDKSKLKKLIMIDILNSDVPSFTKNGDILYHGFDHQIGKKTKH